MCTLHQTEPRPKTLLQKGTDYILIHYSFPFPFHLLGENYFCVQNLSITLFVIAPGFQVSAVCYFDVFSHVFFLNL